jgi:tRNA(fMet)-specific endonuclease VapC
LLQTLIDTNAYSSFMNGDTEVLSSLGSADTVYLSVFVLGELYAGFAGGKKQAENRRILGQFKSNPTVKILHATDETALIFAEVKDRLKKKGTPLPINDVWIAAHAIETGAVLVSYDGHFKAVAGLRLWERVKNDVR